MRVHTLQPPTAAHFQIACSAFAADLGAKELVMGPHNRQHVYKAVYGCGYNCMPGSQGKGRGLLNAVFLTQDICSAGEYGNIRSLRVFSISMSFGWRSQATCAWRLCT